MTALLHSERCLACLFVVGSLCLALQGVADAAISASSLKPKQGQTIEVTVTADDPSAVPVVYFDQRPFKALPVGDSGTCAALVPIPADLDPGKYKIRAGNESLELEVVSGRFPLQRLTLPKSKAHFHYSPGEREAVDKAKAELSGKRLWQGSFLQPSAARRTTGFGVRRIVNGQLLKDYFHSGIDYAGAMGSPVRATAAGKVRLVGKGFRVHGNTVAIDHGHGVISFYIHLKDVTVQEGQTVKAGALIGHIGNTGRASGPHLHFSLYVNQVATNPVDWFSNAF